MDLLRRGSRSGIRKGIWGCLAWAGAGMSLALLAGSCNRDFDNPFLPDSEGYAGSAWSMDRDGDGIADSVEKYAPGCGGGPAECLRQARANAGGGGGLGLDSVDTDRTRVSVASISAADLTLAPGRSRTPEIVILPANATDTRYELLTHDPRVALIRDGLVEGVAPGRTLVTARSLDGARQALFRVTVIRGLISIGAQPIRLRVGGEAMDPILEFTPADAGDRSYSLSGGHPDIATVTADGQRVKPVGVGTVWFTASAAGGLTAAFTATVEPGGNGKGKKDGD